MAGLSNHFDIMTYCQLAIDGLGLGLNTIIQPVLDVKVLEQLPLPLLSISPFGPEQVSDELNDQDGVAYPVLLALLVGTDPNVAANEVYKQLEPFLQFRQQIRRRLNNSAIAGLPVNYNLKIEPGNVVEKSVWQERKLIAGAFVLRAYCQETRIT